MSHEITMKSHQEVQDKKKKSITLKVSIDEKKKKKLVKKMKTLYSSQESLKSSLCLRKIKEENSIQERIPKRKC